MINSQKVIDCINVGVLTLDMDLNIYSMNKWFSVHCGICEKQAKKMNLLDIFDLTDEKLKSLKRHIKAALILKGPSFYTADANQYLFQMKHSLTTKSIFEFMQQDVTILPYDIEKKQVTLLVYDQTTLMEEKMKCHKESNALEKAMNAANATIKKLESAKNKLVKQKDIIYKQAHYDHLTSLANRSLLHQRLELLIQDSIENTKRFAILFLDLDNFKEVNDVHGHDVGDALLIYVAKILLQATRRTDTVARIGGDEFIILLDDVDDEKMIVPIAKKLLHALDQTVKINEHDLHVTTSIGISIYPDHGSTFTSLLKNADIALYDAKATGRNNFKIF